ncbi:uncharacterized protein LOC126184355 [Schistocerca cancellata]|uniref:uncharacterized protein LOC126184355 n=1 Tax=Schistocerca cancellata TaxID=274614 RepID=UPI002117C2E5|nr:uncharacterized protein LOC126184355 [Schistocerca cancellata]
MSARRQLENGHVSWLVESNSDPPDWLRLSPASMVTWQRPDGGRTRLYKLPTDGRLLTRPGDLQPVRDFQGVTLTAAVVVRTIPQGELLKSYLAFRHPTSQGLRSSLFAPFCSSVWVASGAVWLLIMSSLRLITWIGSRQAGSIVQAESSWGAVVVFAACAIGLQGTTERSQWLSWRVVLLFTFLLSLMLNTYYGAAVVGSLLVPPPKTIRTLRHLIDSPIQVGIEDIGYNRDYLEKSTDPVVRELFVRKVFPPTAKRPAYYPIDVGVERMRTSLFAFQAEAVTMYPLILRTFSERGKCALSEIILVPHGMTYLAVPKGSPLREHMSYGLRKVWESGLLNYQERIWHPPRPPCLQAGEAESIRIMSVAPAFLIAIAGIPLACLIACIEQLRSEFEEIFLALSTSVSLS